ncbi:hypothetical protein BJ944DRAFT_227756 [Cunninghamella echinulata]|nr:hypothetical protein BJ944DRAFT_227756 [Cunninghamella echinulata]
MEEEKEIPQQNYDDTDFKNINIILNTISLFSTLILAIILVVLRFKLNKRPKWLNYPTTVSFFLLFRRFNPSIYYCLIPVVLALVSGGVSIIFDPYNATENECWYTTGN